ncbi:PIN domain-containing protein [Ramlibacter albus]|uniref:PIN domain-containing protein n=1 Tax=Ramlibacter albus TaxID=2079448 RepID=A0A923S6Q9_9BURK|nr:PIN domain-containing protein [Ramlibacter albus]MBC5766402.1 PIN domain-containing protein [Ramlibacter albus]
MRVFLDANILFSAAKSDGAIRQLIKLMLEDGHAVVVDEFVLHEARRNLGNKAGAEGLEALHKLESVFVIGATRPVLSAEWLQWLPEKDRPVLAAAVALKCEVLVTGDRKHFGQAYGKSYHGVKVLSAAMAALSIVGPR